MNNSKRQLKKLNFEFLAWVQICLRNPPFPTTQNSKKVISYMLKYFLNFVLETLKIIFIC